MSLELLHFETGNHRSRVQPLEPKFTIHALVQCYCQDSEWILKSVLKLCQMYVSFDILYLMIIMFELSLLQASINLQRRFEIHMQLITMRYLTFCPEYLPMCKWCVFF